MNENRLHLAPEADKPTAPDPHWSQPQHRRGLLEMHVSAGLSVAAVFLRKWLLANPNASLAACQNASRVITEYALLSLPPHVDVAEVRGVLTGTRVRRKGAQEGRDVHK